MKILLAKNNQIKITTLIENHPDEENKLQYEHGLSFLIESKDSKILFDTGESGLFIKNAENMGIDLKELDYLVISHGHHDHGGGVIPFLKKGWKPKKILVGKGFFEKKYRQRPRRYEYNGCPFELEELEGFGIPIETIEVKNYQLTSQIILFRECELTNEIEKLNEEFVIREVEQYKRDDFQDELSIGILTEEGIILIVGCGHRGIIHIMQAVEFRCKIPVIGIIGGTHLVEVGEDRYNSTMREFRKRKLKFLAVSHCTGESNIRQMQSMFGERFIMNVTGNSIQF